MDTGYITSIFANNPEIGALLVLVAGVVLARVLANAFTRLAIWLDRIIARYSTGDLVAISPARLTLLRSFVFWLTLGIAVIVALRLLGVGGFAAALDQVLGFIPSLLVGLAIVGIGHLLGTVVRGLVMRLDTQSTMTLAPRILYAVVLSVAIVMSLEQMGIDTRFITQLVLVTLVISLGGLTLAFALGSRDYVANLISRSELDRFAIGDRLQVGKYRGSIVEIRKTGLDLATSEGVVSIPAAKFARLTIIQLSADTDE